MVVGTYCRLLLVVVVVVGLLPVHALPFKKCSPTTDVQLTKKVHRSGSSSLSTGRKADSAVLFTPPPIPTGFLPDFNNFSKKAFSQFFHFPSYWTPTGFLLDSYWIPTGLLLDSN